MQFRVPFFNFQVINIAKTAKYLGTFYISHLWLKWTKSLKYCVLWTLVDQYPLAVTRTAYSTATDWKFVKVKLHFVKTLLSAGVNLLLIFAKKLSIILQNCKIRLFMLCIGDFVAQNITKCSYHQIFTFTVVADKIMNLFEFNGFKKFTTSLYYKLISRLGRQFFKK